MVQETTEQFGRRLAQALEAFPEAPPTSHGRLTWLKRALEKKAGVKVSVNTVHKWVNGVSRPREDNMRALARVLMVDELWLAMGRRPVDHGEAAPPTPERAHGVVLLVAGMVEVNGGRVTFPDAEAEGTPHLHVNWNGEQFGVVAVLPQAKDGSSISFVIPEPVGDARVVAVIQDGDTRLLDLTEVPRRTFGGFSVTKINAVGAGQYETEAGEEIPTFFQTKIVS
ncbi:helix-turn-helix domain-containing protein [Maritimibacter sp. DP07]|uniref:Helix-turn-helix domain-containing protein n=1 Tax=Maritimibacter harenae TaxID=2606218 RepID=A0A845M033_9RHOB|nr:helix-turn-helix domain-containing protein [Maritimibacter harenae]MZR13405.1 helix-turn-helix domain-containing protein [Maritimibacter harenae]